MTEIVLDAKEMKSREKAHQYIKQKLEFPEYYGENLDALWDMLTAYDREVKIKLINEDCLIDNLGDYGESIIQIFKDLENQ